MWRFSFASPGAFIMTSTFKSLRGGRYVFSPEAKLVLRWNTSKVPVKYRNWSLKKSSCNQTSQVFGCSMFEYVLVIWSKCWKFLDYTLKVSHTNNTHLDDYDSIKGFYPGLTGCLASCLWALCIFQTKRRHGSWVRPHKKGPKTWQATWWLSGFQVLFRIITTWPIPLLLCMTRMTPLTRWWFSSPFETRQKGLWLDLPQFWRGNNSNNI